MPDAPRRAELLEAFDIIERLEPDSPDHALAAFSGVRSRLFGIAYRMLGSSAEAEDVVQDTWLRWQCADRSGVLDPAAYLCTTATRLAINVAKSAPARRETYIGPWLPEPVDTASDPNLGAERGEALEMAILMLLEKLTPTERAAYVLREAFDYQYRQIAEILRLTEENARQLVTRARKSIADGRRARVSLDEHKRLLGLFLQAAQTGDTSALEGLFAADVVSYSDGGGFVRAAGVPLAGRDRVAKFIAAFSSHFWTGVTITWVEANGRPAALISRGGAPVGMATIGVSEQGIDEILWQLRPSKLVAIARLAGEPRIG